MYKIIRSYPLAIIVVISITILASCKPTKLVTCPIREEYYESVKIDIPKHKKKQVFLASAEAPVDYIFWYKDSAAIYVSTEIGSSFINTEIPHNQDSLSSKWFFSDSITISGINYKGFLWKEHKVKGIHIGYINVRPRDKKMFDRSIDNYIIVDRKKKLDIDIHK